MNGLLEHVARARFGATAPEDQAFRLIRAAERGVERNRAIDRLIGSRERSLLQIGRGHRQIRTIALRIAGHNLFERADGVLGAQGGDVHLAKVAEQRRVVRLFAMQRFEQLDGRSGPAIEKVLGRVLETHGEASTEGRHFIGPGSTQAGSPVTPRARAELASSARPSRL